MTRFDGLNPLANSEEILGVYIPMNEAMKQMVQKGKEVIFFGVDHHLDLGGNAVIAALQENPIKATRLMIEGNSAYQQLVDRAFTEMKQNRVKRLLKGSAAINELKEAMAYEAQVSMGEYHRIVDYMWAAKKGGFEKIILAGDTRVGNNRETKPAQEREKEMTDAILGKDLAWDTITIPDSNVRPDERRMRLYPKDFGLAEPITVPAKTIVVVGATHANLSCEYRQNNAIGTAALVNSLSDTRAASINVTPTFTRIDPKRRGFQVTLTEQISSTHKKAYLRGQFTAVLA